MPRVVHFEILSQDPEKAADFYHRLLGWEFQSPKGPPAYWLASTGPDTKPGINGGIMGAHLKQSVINTIEVESLTDTLARLKKLGGKVVLGPRDLPGVGVHAYCEDPDGILFGILEH